MTDIKSLYYKKLSSSQKQTINNIKPGDIINTNTELSFITDPDRMKKYCDILLERYWVIYRNNFHIQYPFITSDIPINYYNYEKKSIKLSDCGLQRPNTVINFPINSQLLLCLNAPTHWMRYTQCYDNKVIDLKINQNDISFISSVNRVQLEQSNRQVFYNAKDDQYIKLFVNSKNI